MSKLTGCILFLTYLNVPAVLVREHGLPLAVAAAVPLLLAIPIAYRLLWQGAPIRFPPLLWAAAALLAVQGVSALGAADPASSMTELLSWFFEGLLLTFLVLNAVRSRDDILVALEALVLAGATMGLIVVIQQLTGTMDSNYYGFAQLDAQIGGDADSVQRRLAGPIGETNRFAQILTLLLPISIALASASRERWRKTAHLLASLLILGGVALTFSRGAILALLVAAPIAVAFGMLKLRHLFIAGVLGLLLLIALPQYLQRIESLGQVAVSALGLAPAGFQSADGATRGRLTEMQAAGLMFLNHPLLGVGPGMAREHYPEYAALVGGKVRPGARRAHNLYLQLAAETGIFGLLAFIALLFAILIPLDRLRRISRYDRETAMIAAGVELALIILLVTSLFLHAAYVRYLWLPFALAGSVSLMERPPVLARALDDLLEHMALRLRSVRS